MLKVWHDDDNFIAETKSSDNRNSVLLTSKNSENQDEDFPIIELNVGRQLRTQRSVAFSDILEKSSSCKYL
jgi:hypothetical protein